MLKLSNIGKSFDDNTVLKDITFEVAQGEVVGMVGPSGGGKSVLLKILGGVIQPDRGDIEFAWNEAEGQFGSSIGFLFQEGALFDSMTVLQNVAFPLRQEKDYKLTKNEGPECEVACVSRGEANDRAFEILKEVGLDQAWKKLPGQLSGGMRRRVGIARALVSRPRIVLLDDPTGGLDPVAASIIMNLISDLQRHYSPTVIIVSHDLRRLLPRVERVLALFDGAIVSDLPPNRLEREAPPDVVRFLSTRFDFSSLAA